MLKLFQRRLSAGLPEHLVVYALLDNSLKKPLITPQRYTLWKAFSFYDIKMQLNRMLMRFPGYGYSGKNNLRHPQLLFPLVLSIPNVSKVCKHRIHI